MKELFPTCPACKRTNVIYLDDVDGVLECDDCKSTYTVELDVSTALVEKSQQYLDDYGE